MNFQHQTDYSGNEIPRGIWGRRGGFYFSRKLFCQYIDPKIDAREIFYVEFIILLVIDDHFESYEIFVPLSKKILRDYLLRWEIL